MTGMPAFGKTHQANEIWPVVAFLQSARDLTSTDYNRMKEKAQDYGHHRSESDAHEDGNSGHDQEEGFHSHSEPSDDKQVVGMPSQQETLDHNHGEDETHNIEHHTANHNSSEDSHIHDHSH